MSDDEKDTPMQRVFGFTLLLLLSVLCVTGAIDILVHVARDLFGVTCK